MAKVKSFIKRVGGKGQLIKQLKALLPADFSERKNVTYIEAFVGGDPCSFIRCRHIRMQRDCNKFLYDAVLL